MSCYIRTLNEERRIAATVRAALQAVSEVVVVDSGSTDATVALAQAAGARIVEQAWLGGGRQKRVGEDACRHDWLLSLDADEVVTAALAQEIRALFADAGPDAGPDTGSGSESGGGPEADVYRLRMVLVDPAGRVWRRARPTRRAKLYDRRRLRMPDHGAWDQLDIPAGVKVGRLDGMLLHHAFDDIAHLSRKQTSAMVRRVRFLSAGRPAAIALRVYCGLPWFFLRSYLLRGHWREGGYGFLLSVTGAYSHWLRYAMLHERRLKGRDGGGD